MKKIDWYIIRKFLGTFFYAIALIIVIVVFFDYSEKIENFMSREAPLKAIIFDYYLNFIPYFVNMFSALFTFIAVIFFTSKLSQNSEFIAMFGTGISLKRLAIPYLISALLIGILNLYLANFLIPNLNGPRQAFEARYVFYSKGNNDVNVHFQYNDTTFYYAESMNFKDGVGFNFSREIITPKEGLRDLLKSESIRYDAEKKTWALFSVIHRRIEDSITIHTTQKSSMELALDVVPADFKRQFHDVTVMDFNELNAFIDQERLRGSTSIRAYEYERQMRFSHPFATIVMTLIGLALASQKRKGGVGLQLSIGLLLTFLFILFLQLTRVFATLGNFPVWLAAWLPIIVFGLAGIILFLRSDK